MQQGHTEEVCPPQRSGRQTIGQVSVTNLPIPTPASLAPGWLLSCQCPPSLHLGPPEHHLPQPYSHPTGRCFHCPYFTDEDTQGSDTEGPVKKTAAEWQSDVNGGLSPEAAHFKN